MKMKCFLLVILWLFNYHSVDASNNHLYQSSMHHALALIKQNHAYLADSKLSWSCLEEVYLERAKQARNSQDILSAFEHLMLEFADNHMMLNTNNNQSYRLYAPLVVRKLGEAFIIDDFWKSQLNENTAIMVGAKVLRLNQSTPQQIIADFPTSCLDKNNQENQTWIINKALAGVYSQPRELTVLHNDKTHTIDLDQLTFKKHQTLLNQQVKQNIGIIEINNSLGNTDLIKAFDQALNQMHETDGLILDLRNTISGGDSYMARAIMGRLIAETQAYQKHHFIEQRGGAEGVTRSWLEFVSPRGQHYKQPVVVLANHWTGSMGEGITIGLQGMGRATWIGNNMAGLLGSVNQFQLNGLWFSIQMPIEQLYRVDGVPRESAKPDLFIQPNAADNDKIMTAAIEYLQMKNQ